MIWFLGFFWVGTKLKLPSQIWLLSRFSLCFLLFYHKWQASADCLQFEQLSVFSLTDWELDGQILLLRTLQTVEQLNKTFKILFKKKEKKVKSVQELQERLSASLRSSFGINYKSDSSWKSEKVRLFKLLTCQKVKLQCAQIIEI